MDFHLKQCNKQDESEQQHSAKISKFVLLEKHQQPPTASSALPLFVVPDSHSKNSSILSAFPDSTSSSSRFPRMWGYFSVAQRQELELQALIFRYMLAGAAIPPELLHPIKKSLLTPSTPFFLQHYPQYPTSLLQSGYWGRAAMDPEPGRCRRTDGKKWRCSRDVVVGQKYCERHMHRGRNRSRKPVETTTLNPTTASAAVTGSSAGCGGPVARPLRTAESGKYFSVSGQSPSIDLLHLNQSGCSDSITEHKSFYESQTEAETKAAVGGGGNSDGHILRHFFDDWPRSLKQSDNGGSNGMSQQINTNPASASATSPENLSSSDVSLKLSTGSGGPEGHSRQDGNADREQVQLNWAAGWAATQMVSMGGPLAEALRSANNNASPTSVLHQLQRASTSEASFVST